MEQLDADGSGEVSMEEFEEFWKSNFSGLLVQGSRLAALMAQFADTRHIAGVAYHPDRYIDPDDEMRARCWALFEEIDGNHDNFISYMEFMGWWKRMDKAEHHGKSTISDDVLRESQIKFTAFDANGNGSIDRDELAGLIRALDLEKYVPSADDLEDENPPLYTVSIHTGGHPDAGTDTGVYVALFGSNGDTGKRELATKNAAESFNRGQINTFKLRSVDVGDIAKVTIGHDNTSRTSEAPDEVPDQETKWQLDKVVVTKRGGEPVTFGCAEWLDAGSGDKRIERELVPGEKEFKTEEPEVEESSENPLAKEKVEPKDDMGSDRKLILECGTGLKNVDSFFGGKSDPYAIVSWNGRVLGKTKIVDNSLHPIWGDEFEFDVGEEGLLRIEVYDHDVFFRDELLGKVELKLGGASNPRGMLSRADYSFQEPDEFPGNVTLRVEHGSHRFTTEEQLLFRDRWNLGESLRHRREKHVFETYTRTAVLLITAIMTIFGIFLGGFAVYLMGMCETSPYIAWAYLVMSPLITISSAVGCYGAWRVKKDVEAEKSLTEGKMAEGIEDDGLQTPGQHILEGYFHATLLIVICWLWIIIETLAVGTAGADAECHADHDAGVMLLGWGGVVVILVMCFAMYCVIKICSFFEILQSLAEGINLCLLLLGIMVAMLAALIFKQTLCLTPREDLGTQSGNLTLAGMLMFYGLCIVSASFYGFVAAVHESMSHLAKHAVMLATLTFLGLILTFVLFFRGIDSLVDDQCELLLRTLPATFFEEYASCDKYRGFTEMWNGTGWQVSQDVTFVEKVSKEPFTGDLGETVVCTRKSLTAYAWEVNPTARLGGGVVNFYGCLNIACCDAIKDKMHDFDYGIVALFLMLFVMMFAGIYASLYLRYETTVIGHILIHPYAKRIFIVMKLLILLACIVMPFVFTGSNCGNITRSELESKMNLRSSAPAQPPAAVLVNSCFNGFMDGKETDIDCGGNCVQLCERTQACYSADDCVAGLLCATRPDSEVPKDSRGIPSRECWDRRCVPGQAKLSPPLTGFCEHPTAEVLCSDGTQNYRETCEDGGGPDCRPLGNLCGAGSACRSSADCSDSVSCVNQICTAGCNGALAGLSAPTNNCGGSDCTPCADTMPCVAGSDCSSGLCYIADPSSFGTCVSYFNGFMDGKETDVDCGGDPDFGCGLGGACDAHTDCITGNCDSGACALPTPRQTCADGEQNFLETDIDCGGPACTMLGKTCDTGSACKRDTDCQAGSCFADVCFGCADGVKNGDETDIDCGGLMCARKCGDGQDCVSDIDCQHNRCFDDGTGQVQGQGVCTSFYNNVQDDDETDVDCGGSAATLEGRRCTVGQKCATNFDCFTTVCGRACTDSTDVDTCELQCQDMTPAMLCSDGEQSGLETDIDCGGAACATVQKACDEGMQCLEDSDCASGICDPASLRCVSCVNGLQDGDETDVDCGGSVCAQCLDGDGCQANGHCTSGVCFLAGGSVGVCVSCTNGFKDGGEPDIDCGGDCTKGCSLDRTCLDNSDCAVGNCKLGESGFRCTPETPAEQCSNGIQNPGETGVDCGGPSCRTVDQLCAEGVACNGDADCSSSVCFFDAAADSEDNENPFGACVSCSNSRKDGDETDIDCGGRACGKCTHATAASPDAAQQCKSDGDCASSLCYIASLDQPGTCVSYYNGVPDGDETCTDGGGSAAAALAKTCPVGGPCAADRDCSTGKCDTNTDPGSPVCRELTPTESCNNNLLDGLETDVDCGGQACATVDKRCAAATADAPAGSCFVGSDCASGLCVFGAAADSEENENPFGDCVSCTNGLEDGDETDVDCGGPACVTCNDHLSCLDDTDCTSNTCTEGSCAVNAQGTECNNGAKSGDESDVDCGGRCNKCADGKLCTINEDCTSHSCVGGTCASCSNGIKDADEADVDCGATACPVKCDQGSTCEVHADCASNNCEGNVCGAPHPRDTCIDGQKGELETCVDGGGECQPMGKLCPTCETGAEPGACSCNVDNDCEAHRCSSLGSCYDCANGLQDGDETDVDCGGYTVATHPCNKCLDGKLCVANADCSSNSCVGGTCVSCANGIKDGDEADVDCGATACPDSALCAQTSTCLTDADCASQNCNNNVCEPPTPEMTCNDGKIVILSRFA